MAQRFEVRKMNNEKFPIKGINKGSDTVYICSGWGVYSNMDKEWVCLKDNKPENYPFLVATESQAKAFLNEIINSPTIIYSTCIQ